MSLGSKGQSRRYDQIISSYNTNRMYNKGDVTQWQSACFASHVLA